MDLVTLTTVQISVLSLTELSALVLAAQSPVSGHLETNIRTHLAASGVTAPIRPFTGAISDDGDLVTYARISTQYDDHLGGPTQLVHASIQYDCWSATYLGAVALAESVRLNIQGLRGDIGNSPTTNVRNLFAGNTFDSHEQAAGGQGKPIYRQTFEIRVAYIATASTAN